MTMSENDDLEKPDADAAEQEIPVAGEPGEPVEEPAAELPFDASEADAAEQHREVRLDEDEYR
jgi:hypothetical protein